MKRMTAALFAGTCVLAIGASAASAAIVCNREGDCWHAKQRYSYRPEFGLTVHPDRWKWAEREHDKFRWREHEGRGYWRDGVWKEF